MDYSDLGNLQWSSFVKFAKKFAKTSKRLCNTSSTL